MQTKRDDSKVKEMEMKRRKTEEEEKKELR